MENNRLKNIRDNYIELMDNSEDSTNFAKIHGDDLYSLGLTVYSKYFTIDSIFYNSFALSVLDENISLHPEQLKVIEKIRDNEAIVLSAPTSFGKTFCIFEYIGRFYPQNIVLIVPTLALIDEYTKKIIKKYSSVFRKYKLHSNILEGIEVDFSKYNIFIMTHERIISGMDLNFFKSIDFLVIDEVYKLNTDVNDDRVLVLNMAYYYMSKISKKYVLLAPFIKKIENIELLEKKPYFISTEFSPVVNKVFVEDILIDKDRMNTCKSILFNKIDENDKTLIYFPTVASLYKYVNEIIIKEPKLLNIDSNIYFFLEWAKNEIHEEWAIVKALERGYLIHNGQVHLGTRVFLLDLFDKLDSGYNKLLCTASLLEGVNTSAKNIIITKPSRRKFKNNGDNFTAFDFFNLVGRTGRLYQHFVGNAYYIKGPNDPYYHMTDAKRSIKFELYDESKDISVQLGACQNYDDVQKFYSSLRITNEEYVKNIGTKLRIDNCIKLYNIYCDKENELIGELYNLTGNEKRGRYNLIYLLNTLCGFDDSTSRSKINAYILNELINLRRLNVKTIVDSSFRYCQQKNIKMTINDLISIAIKYKTGYIEHKFYNRCSVIFYFLEKRGAEQKILNTFQKNVLTPIEIIFFTNSPIKKALYDMGIYEKDIDEIVEIVGDNYDDIYDLKRRLIENFDLFENLSFISKYVIKSLI